MGPLGPEGFIAPLTVDGDFDGELFRGWVEQRPASVFKKPDLVVMDDLSSRKVTGIRQSIKPAGAELRCLPPHSPDLNPIDLAFTKIKKLLSDGAERSVNGP